MSLYYSLSCYLDECDLRFEQYNSIIIIRRRQFDPRLEGRPPCRSSSFNCWSVPLYIGRGNDIPTGTVDLICICCGTSYKSRDSASNPAMSWTESQ